MKLSAPSFVLCFVLLFASLSTLAQTVPQPPTQRADRFGIYNWGVDYAAYSVGPTDRLNWAADKIAGLGSRTIRIALPGNTYLINAPGVTDLAQIATSPAYDKLFSDLRFQTYLLTAYSATDQASIWSDGFSLPEYYATRDEFARLGAYLLSQPRYAGKTFILLNWEGDNAMQGLTNKQTIWDAYAAWIQARADGVRAARQQQPNSTAKVFSGLEFNLVRTTAGVPCGTPVMDRIATDPLKNRCVIDYVAPRVNVDYYSYSAWQTITAAAWEKRPFKTAINQDLQFALNLVRSKRPQVQEQNFLLGEYGFHRSYWGESTVANFVNATFDALEAPDAFRVSYAIFWQIIDNAPWYLNGDDGFGLYRSRHGRFNLTRAGQAWQKRLAGEPVNNFSTNLLIRVPTEEITNAPEAAMMLSPMDRSFAVGLAPNGAVPVQPAALDAEERRMKIEAPDPSARFSPSNNAVRLEQGIRQFSLTREQPGFVSESETQIITGVPAALRPGMARVYVNDRDGVESNAQWIRLRCPACPEITGVEDTGRKLGALHPGSVLTLFGRNFSAANNRLFIEQQDAEGRPQHFIIPRDDVWQEAPDRITARLPNALLPNKLAIAVVINALSAESNEFVLWITPNCPTCAPVIRPSQGVLNRTTQSESFYVGASIILRGERFSTSGNRVLVEQGQRRFPLTATSETPTQVTTVLPEGLLPGQAIVYVIDSEGRESRAQAITITNMPMQRTVGAR